MKWQNVANERLVTGSLIDAWTMKLDTTRKAESRPSIYQRVSVTVRHRR